MITGNDSVAADNQVPLMRGYIQENANGELSVQKNIIPSLVVARTQYEQLRIDHLTRIATYAIIEGQIAGNPPFDQAELDSHGLGHIANYNNFKARSYYERTAQTYWNLINATEVFLKVRLAGKDSQFPRWANIIARHFNDVVREWDDFYTNLNLLGAQITKFGWCPIYWSDEKSWMWEVVDVSKCFLPAQTQTLKSKLTNICIESNYTVQDLYTIYTKATDSSPWNEQALANFLILRANTFIRNNEQRFTNILELQRRLQNNDQWVATYYNDSVRLVNLFQQEYDGKISHYIFDRDVITPTRTAPESQAYPNTASDFLFFLDRQYKSFSEAIVIYTASPGEWTIHSNLGIGHKTYAGAQAINLLDCTIVDMARMAATPIVRSTAVIGKEVTPIRFMPGVAADVGASEFIQNNLGANINQLVLASQHLSTTLDINAANSGEDPAQADRSQGSVSPTQYKMQSFSEFGVLKNNIAHFYKQFDDTIQNMFVKMLHATPADKGYEYAKEWKLRCIEDGVPEFLFDTSPVGLKGLPRQFRKVSASRVAGDGSTLARIMGLDSLGKLVGSFNEAEMADYKREYVEATLGVDYVPAFASSSGQPDESAGGASLAGIENILMKQGEVPTFSPDNEQRVHALKHMELIQQTINAVQQQQISAVDADRVLTVAIPHTSEHISFMAKSPLLYGQILQQIEKPFGQMVKLAQLYRKNAQAMIQSAIRQQQEEAAATQQVMNDQQRKDFVAKKDQERKDYETGAKLERAAEANETRAEIMRTKTSADIENRRRETDAKVEEATAKARTQQELNTTPIPELQSDLSVIAGNTPSTTDFE